MKIFYDMFIPYMPDQDINDRGELVASKSRESARDAMIDLANFQKTGAIMHLYHAVLHACMYAEVDLVTEILGLPDNLEIPNISINEAVDICAKDLFRSVNPNYKFDIDKFVSLLLTSAHFALEAIGEEQQVQPAEVAETPAADSPDLGGQISLDEVMGKD